MVGKNLAKSGKKKKIEFKKKKIKNQEKKEKKKKEEKNGVYMCWCISMTPNQRRTTV